VNEPQPRPFRVVLVDDHEMLIDCFVRLLRVEPDIDVGDRLYLSPGQ
jgi:hypothetical protein